MTTECVFCKVGAEFKIGLYNRGSMFSVMYEARSWLIFIMESGCVFFSIKLRLKKNLKV